MPKQTLFALAVWSLTNAASGGELQYDERAKNSDELPGEMDRGFVRSLEDSNAVPLWRDLDRWSFQAGVGLITASTIDELVLFQGELAEDDARGEMYLLQASYKIHEFKPEMFGRRLDLDLELPMVLGVVNERGRSPFMQYNGGITLRWKSFPWNNWLYTNLETGCGLTYSQRVVETERQRHPTRHRSHLEFYWPMQLMLAHPRHRDHQLVFFLHHHSGSAVLHTGGANTFGIGYRYVPGER